MSLSKSLLSRAKKYLTLDDTGKAKFLREAYEECQHSIPEIAEACGTYNNKIRRDLKRFGIHIRSRSEAQKLALASGRHEHPTQDKGHTEESKIKMSEKMSEVYDNLSDAAKKERSEAGKEQWNRKSKAEKELFIKTGQEHIREAAKHGSKLERFLHKELLKAGYQVSCHEVHMVKNQRLHIDLYVKDLATIIEVDGPSHERNVWGTKELTQTKTADAEKDALVLNLGMVLIRVKQTKSLSAKFKRDVLAELLATLERVKTKRPRGDNRYIVLGDK